MSRPALVEVLDFQKVLPFGKNIFFLLVLAGNASTRQRGPIM
jgi:hypothetical protein